MGIKQQHRLSLQPPQLERGSDIPGSEEQGCVIDTLAHISLSIQEGVQRRIWTGLHGAFENIQQVIFDIWQFMRS